MDLELKASDLLADLFSGVVVLEYVRELQTQPNNLLALWQRELVLQRGDKV